MIKVEEKKHAKYSASGSERWLNCPGSIALSERAGPSKETIYAREGTEAHTCLEVVIKNDGSPKAVAMLKKQFPNEMVNHALRAYEQIVEHMPSGSKLEAETEVRLDFVERGMFGTTDAVIIELFGILWVIDYKYGKGRVVEPDENTQMIYYALGTAHKLDYNFEKARLVVLQPRVVHKKGIFRHWDIEMPALMKWKEKFKEGVEACKDPFADLNEGRWCFFCPAQHICPLQEQDRWSRAQADFDNV